MYKIYFLLIAYDLLYFNQNNIIFIEFFYSLTKMEIKKKKKNKEKKVDTIL